MAEALSSSLSLSRGGAATLITSTLAVGSNTVNATYSGSSTIGGSTAWITSDIKANVRGICNEGKAKGYFGGFRAAVAEVRRITHRRL